MLKIEPVYLHEAEHTCHRILSKSFLDSRSGAHVFEVFKPHSQTIRTPSLSTDTLRLFCDGNLRRHNHTPGDEDRLIAWKLSFSISQNLSYLWAQAPYSKSIAIEVAHAKAALTTRDELIGCLWDDKEMGGCTSFILGYKTPLLSSREPPWNLDDGFLKKKSYCTILSSARVSEEGQPQPQIMAFLLNSGSEKNHLRQSILMGAALDELDKHLKESYEGALDFYLEKTIGNFIRLRESNEMRIEGVPQAAVRRFFFETPPPNNHGAIAPGQTPSLFQRRSVWQKEGEKLGFGLREATALLNTFERNRVRFDFKSAASARGSNGKALFRRAADAISKLTAIARKKPSNNHTDKNHKSKGQSH